ncbi:MAG: Yip1 family protein, partial [Acidobacteriota bacterium]
SYILNLAATYAFGFIINALAPSFGSQQNLANAMKLAVYGLTPIWVAGVLYIIAFRGFLYWLVSLVMIAAAVYSIYVLYLGFATPLLGTPKDKVAGYLIVSAVVAIVLFVVLGIILGAIFAVRGLVGLF